jgi:hypothetical protein
LLYKSTIDSPSTLRLGFRFKATVFKVSVRKAKENEIGPCLEVQVSRNSINIGLTIFVIATSGLSDFEIDVTETRLRD